MSRFPLKCTLLLSHFAGVGELLVLSAIEDVTGWGGVLIPLCELIPFQGRSSRVKWGEEEALHEAGSVGFPTTPARGSFV